MVAVKGESIKPLLSHYNKAADERIIRRFCQLLNPPYVSYNLCTAIFKKY
jgi:hypothetical protein